MSDPTPLVDPGTEVLDLPDELRMSDDEARSWLDVDPHIVTPDLARLTGHAGDYRWLTWLADVLRAAGCSVVEYPGWKTRGRPRTAGPFVPWAVMWHHDASPAGPSPSLAKFIAVIGRDDVPAPLSQLWVCAGCNGAHPVGTWHVLAAGRANHAGTGNGWGAIGRDAGNSQAIGVETDNTTGEKTPRAMLHSLEVGTAAILNRLGERAGRALCGHKEYAAGRKVDPDDIDMDAARDRVLVLQRDPEKPAPPKPATPGPKPGGPKPGPGSIPFPGANHFNLGEPCRHGFVGILSDWLNRAGYTPNALQLDGPVFTRKHRQAVEKFQRDHKTLASDPDGVPGPLTWRLLQGTVRDLGK